MVRSIEGHGLVIASRPPPSGTLSPLSLRISALMPGKAWVADPGLVRVMPGSGVMAIAPVSVCHHVSTIGQRLLPMCRWYQIQASGLIGPPTEPINRSERRLCLAGQSVPHFIKARIAVGAV